MTNSFYGIGSLKDIMAADPGMTRGQAVETLTDQMVGARRAAAGLADLTVIVVPDQTDIGALQRRARIDG